jgi:hypothetical protein
VLNKECGVESDEQQPEVNLAQRLIQHPASELWPPEVEASKHREDNSAKHHVVEVRNNEVGI